MDAAETETTGSDALGIMIVSGNETESGIDTGIMVIGIETAMVITTAEKAAIEKVPTGITATVPGHVTESTAPPGAESTSDAQWCHRSPADEACQSVCGSMAKEGISSSSSSGAFFGDAKSARQNWSRSGLTWPCPNFKSCKHVLTTDGSRPDDA